MKKDIDIPEVKGVSVGIAQEQNEFGEVQWKVYLINQKSVNITGVLISSNGYGEKSGERIKTSTLRHYFDNIPSKSCVLVEPIMEDLFGITNEYWVSYYIDQVIYDKRFIFLPESIQANHTIQLPVLNKPGILIG